MSDENTKWKKEIAAGGVVYKKQDGSVFVLMINPKGQNFGPPQPYWTWPKGLIDPGEDAKVAATREVREEAGIVGVIIDDLGTVKFFRNFDKVLKFVNFFLMEYESGDPKDHDQEVADAEWVILSEAESRLKFPHDKEILTKAKERLKQ